MASYKTEVRRTKSGLKGRNPKCLPRLVKPRLISHVRQSLFQAQVNIGLVKPDLFPQRTDISLTGSDATAKPYRECDDKIKHFRFQTACAEPF